MNSITLTNPKGKAVAIRPDLVAMVFYSAFLSPEGARCNLIYNSVNSGIRSFAEAPGAVVALLRPHIKLVALTLPKKEDTLSTAIWVAAAKIERDLLEETEDGTVVKIGGQKGVVIVTESRAEIESQIDSAS